MQLGNKDNSFSNLGSRIPRKIAHFFSPMADRRSAPNGGRSRKDRKEIMNVIALFKKYGTHKIVGTIFDEDEKTVSIRVEGGDIHDEQVRWMVDHKVCVMIPKRDIVTRLVNTKQIQ